jgi:hypothetical protein
MLGDAQGSPGMISLALGILDVSLSLQALSDCGNILCNGVDTVPILN